MSGFASGFAVPASETRQGPVSARPAGTVLRQRGNRISATPPRARSYPTAIFMSTWSPVKATPSATVITGIIKVSGAITLAS